MKHILIAILIATASGCATVEPLVSSSYYVNQRQEARAKELKDMTDAYIAGNMSAQEYNIRKDAWIVMNANY